MKHRTKRLTLGLAALVLAACGPEKGKPELAADLQTSIDAVEVVGGRWTEVQLVDSPHPYPDNFAQMYEVRGSPDAVEMRVVFERLELEAGYDFLSVEGITEVLQRLTGTRSGQELLVPGNFVRLRLNTDYSVTGWGFKVRVFERTACSCTPDARPVCGADEQTYANECEAGCAGARVAYAGACRSEAWISVNRSIASAHPYTNNFAQTWRIQEVGATSVRVHFTRLDLERGYDFVRILDGAGQVVASYTGTQDDFHSAVVQGDTLQVELKTDVSVTAFGFDIDSYQVVGGCNVDSDCGAGQVCAAVQCVRAPCFNLCEAASTGGYTDISLADLQRDPAAFDGQRVKVVAEPVVRALCTRRACSAAEPCCNACSGSFTIAGQVALRDASDQPYGCRGNECSWQNTCREFAPENTGPYTFSGVIRADASGGVSLLVDTFDAAACQRAGCSNQACANSPNVITTCDFRPEYACYQNNSSCESQATGHCGWTETPALLQCLANASSQQVSATDVPLAIPDDSTQGVVSQANVPGGGTISQVLVSLQITHTYRGDLIVTLVSPSGTEVVLHQGDGGSADDLVILDRELAELNGETKNGRWTLKVVDRYAQDTGTLEGWSLTFR